MSPSLELLELGAWERVRGSVGTVQGGPGGLGWGGDIEFKVRTEP